MASHYVSLNRGVEGFNYSDFTTGTSSTGTDAVELRVLDGAGLTLLDMNRILEAFERFFQNSQQVKTAAFDVDT